MQWLPLESNPEVLNNFLTKMRVDPTRRFHDVFGLDEELLDMIPKPCLALCLLYPSESISRPRRELYRDKCLRDGDHSCFYLSQHSEFGNACGTIAVIHTVANTFTNVDDESPLKAFLISQVGKTAQEAGYALCDMKGIRETSDGSASTGQTTCPQREDRVSSHFICFTVVNDRLMELDGCQAGPIDHGPVTPAEFVLKAARVIREDFVARDPTNLNFNITAFCAET